MRSGASFSLHSEDSKTGMLLFLAAEGMFFTGFLGACLVLRKIDADWTLDSSALHFAPGLTCLLLLIFSCAAYAFALRCAYAGRRNQAKNAWSLALLAAVTFLFLQSREIYLLWSVKNLLPSKHLFMAAFYGAVFLHGLHVAAGAFFLGKLQLKAASLAAFETLAPYWFFLAASGTAFFSFFYLLNY